MNTYMSGTLVRTVATFTNVSGALTDPTTVILKYKTQIGTVQTPTPVNDSVGVYHVDIDTTGWTGVNELIYTLEWIGEGACQAISTDSFAVTAAPL